MTLYPEISEKLANELVERLDAIESWCDKRAKNDTDWMTAICLCLDLRQHLYWHMQPMAETIETSREEVE